MAMIEDQPTQPQGICPAWLAALPVHTLRRIVVAGCALSWVALIGIFLS